MTKSVIVRTTERHVHKSFVYDTKEEAAEGADFGFRPVPVCKSLSDTSPLEYMNKSKHGWQEDLVENL